MWWENYKGEEVILFDDFYGEARWDEILRLTHEHKYTGNVKGSSIEINPAVVIITANYPPCTWDKWKGKDLGPLGPFFRRVTDDLRFTWEVQDGDRTPHVDVRKGEFLDFEDPPDDTGDIEPKTDAQIEQVISADADAKWIAKRQRSTEALPVQKRPTVRTAGWQGILPEYEIQELPDVPEIDLTEY